MGKAESLGLCRPAIKCIDLLDVPVQAVAAFNRDVQEALHEKQEPTVSLFRAGINARCLGYGCIHSLGNLA